jgi:hypothetical protein
MTSARVLDRNREGREILWQCSECGEPFNRGWGSCCNGCIAAERRHKELVKALRKNGGA